MKKLKGKVVYPGHVKGEALVTDEPIGFYGGVDAKTGVVTQKGHPLEGVSVKDKILVFPLGVGSTVGSYIIFRLKKNRVGPKGIIVREAEPIIAVGAIISEVPMVYNIDINKINTGDIVEILNNGQVIVY
ncbi:MAG: DUF126 domain-containing protein [Candidatus Odinarchaeota archaeon]|nr:DUF126 domain-containing protein [Candidatus Odinarchaeota archaeon]